MGKTQHRRLCDQSECSNAEVLEQVPGPRGYCSRCVSSEVAEERPLSISTLEADTEGYSPPPISPGDRGGPSDSTLAIPILVSNDTTKDSSTTTTFPHIQDSSFNRMAIIRQARKTKGMADDMILFLENNHRKRTIQIYDKSWERWVNWCCSQPTAWNPLVPDRLALEQLSSPIRISHSNP